MAFNRDADMRKTAAAVTLVLVFLAASFLAVVKVAHANPYHHEAVGTKVSPPAGTQAPIINILTPQNGSFYPKNLTLTFDVTVPKTNGDKSIDAVTKLYYKGSWEPNEITITQLNEYGYQKIIEDSASFSIDLSSAPGGNLSITVYAVGVGSYDTRSEFDAVTYTMTTYYDTFEMTSFSTVSFTKDLVPPRITVLSPQNETYSSSEVTLDFTVNENVSQILYTLDGNENQTITGNLTLAGLAKGAHNLTLYVTDLAGNAASSKMLFFDVNLPESFPVVAVAIAAAVIAVAAACAGLLLLNRKRRSTEAARNSPPEEETAHTARFWKGILTYELGNRYEK